MPLQKKHDLEIMWNFFSTSHGKGPVDGIGGAVKRHVWNQVRSRKAVVTSAATFVTAAVGMANVTVSELQQMEIDRRNAHLCLPTVFDNAKPVKGMSSMHFLAVKGDEVASFVITEDGREDATGPDQPLQEKTDQPEPEVCGDDDQPKVGDWYAMEYEGVLYPGEVLALGDQGDYQVSVMQPAGPNWKWPQPRDKIFYVRGKLIVKLDTPCVVNNRGHFKFATQF